MRVAPLRPSAGSGRVGRLVRRLSLAILLVVGLSGCSAEQWYRGGWPAPITVEGKRVLGLWQGTVIASLAVGGFVLFLIVYAAFAFRRTGDQLPRQVKYNIPMEVAYTIVPLVIVSYLFYFTAITENFENRLSKNPDVVIGVVGFQWSWQFNYVKEGLQVTGRPGQIPQLVIPTNRTIRFVETSPDVIHSFWVVPFLFKRDVVPGRHNEFEVTVTKTGVFDGKCAEYCGTNHDRMLFSVKAVTPQQYDQFVKNAQQQTGSSQ